MSNSATEETVEDLLQSLWEDLERVRQMKVLHSRILRSMATVGLMHLLLEKEILLPLPGIDWSGWSTL